jgi:hypothetical protein
MHIHAKSISKIVVIGGALCTSSMALLLLLDLLTPTILIKHSTFKLGFHPLQSNS